MRKIILKHGLLAGIALFVVAVAAPIAVGAVPTRAQEAQESAEERKETAQTTATENKDAAQTRLADAKLKACQKREKAINNIMSRLSDRGTKQLDLFTKIAERTETFYTEKGKTLSNYEALVAEVNAKKAEATTAVAGLKETSVTFACDGTDPKGVASTFKASLKAQNDALKAYKTAVKNLVVGVKSVQGTTSSSEGGQQ